MKPSQGLFRTACYDWTEYHLGTFLTGPNTRTGTELCTALSPSVMGSLTGSANHQHGNRLLFGFYFTRESRNRASVVQYSNERVRGVASRQVPDQN